MENYSIEDSVDDIAKASGQEKRAYRAFLLSISLAVALCLSAIFLGIAIKNWDLMVEEMLSRARAHFDGIVITRMWNASYGGVYVEKREGVESNPYLKNPDIVTVHGKVFTKKNPALMTREISEYSHLGSHFSFKIMSLKPLNPSNGPSSSFDSDALLEFEAGNQHEVFKISDSTFYYIAPLYIQKECLECHADQGYKLGEVKGGIKVAFNIEGIQAQLRRNLIVTILLALTNTGLLLLLIFSFISKLRRNLSKVRSKIEQMAITDGLTGVFNRRYAMMRFHQEFERARRLNRPLGCIMLDIDHFKRINDTYGHQSGDVVLQELTTLISSSVRPYDILGRYGGEEFLLVLPDTDRQDLFHLADRLRREVKAHLMAPPGRSVSTPVTVSLGATCTSEEDRRIDDVIRRADEALYQAKLNGRDRVEWGESGCA